MAKIQHFLPQVLLRGFASRTKRKQGKTQFFVWAFPQAAAPYETNAKNIGAEGFFYQPEETGGIEQRLEKHETRCGLMLERLRQGAPVGQDDAPLICEFVASLVVRTRNLRDGLAEMAKVAGESVARVWANPDNRDAVRRQVREWANAPAHRIHLERLSPKMREQKLRELEDEFISQFPSHVREKMVGLDLDQLATGAQRRALTANVAPEQRVKLLSELTWSVSAAPRHTYVLGDIGPVGSFDEEPAVEPLIKHVSVPRGVYLPISDSRLLIGVRPDTAAVPEGDVLNRAAVELSRDFFVASRCSDVEQQFHRLLGGRASVVSAEQMDRIQEAGLRGP